MGTGKTSVGLALAKRLGRPAHDADALIEADEKRKIAQIFEERGEDCFRQIEKKKIEELSELEGAVITTGGGAVMDPENVARLKKNGVLICLSASTETILKRVGRSKNRPLLKKAADPAKAVEELLAKRRAHYDQAADVTVATDGKSPEEVAAMIETLLNETKLLGGCP